MCGLHATRWVTLAQKRNVWKTFLAVEAQKTFMKTWYERESARIEHRRMSEDRRCENELIRLEALADERDGEQGGNEEDWEIQSLDLGIESEENYEVESEGEDMGDLMENCRRGRVVVENSQLSVVSFSEVAVAERVEANDRASRAFIEALHGIGSDRMDEAFMETLGYSNMDIQNVDHGEESHVGSGSLIMDTEGWHSIQGESFGDKRKRARRERHRRKRREMLDAGVEST